MNLEARHERGNWGWGAALALLLIAAALILAQGHWSVLGPSLLGAFIAGVSGGVLAFMLRHRRGTIESHALLIVVLGLIIGLLSMNPFTDEPAAERRPKVVVFLAVSLAMGVGTFFAARDLRRHRRV